MTALPARGDTDDLRQEALALLSAIRNLPTEHRVPFGNFADVVIRRKFMDALSNATRQKHRHLNEAVNGRSTTTATLSPHRPDARPQPDPADIVMNRETPDGTPA